MLRKHNYYNRPDYSMIYNACMRLIKRLNVKFTDPYDWEKMDVVVGFCEASLKLVVLIIH